LKLNLRTSECFQNLSWVIIWSFSNKGFSFFSFGGKASNAGADAPNSLPYSVKDDVFAHTKLLGPGEKGVIKFIAPSVLGAYQFLCSFPGHYAIMRGIMSVK
jgi:hypothetical protein